VNYYCYRSKPGRWSHSYLFD